ncbi:hypothetical protein SODALDRAFT_334413 [Sodiomyces alkalinus F11]|uniref:t-SNARE coiled-coil homology domain-containing protein n=1 Tax=Sodiomyces alkalinus (strain CBS 110278 / VKM F-3762 / F11) TaxID=1314773 RepID=A0A3N2PSB7_SODAK|nr:hypothetical protein SODALDRAFT_334413 [Sodiomyces alkalinus F11]ROT37324.1 hypothetical protein SODALDRAFT_334413 [Sodiomyces alkalinus F11]
MKKFGFGKKDVNAGDEDASRNALFGRKKQSPAPMNDNPYARAGPSNDPYAQSSKSASPAPSQQSRAGLPSGPGGLRRDPSSSSASSYSQPPPPYGASDPSERSTGRYGADTYGAAGGYGDNRYDTGSGPGANRYGPAASASRRPGGYGGLGPAGDGDSDAQRDQLFSGAQQRQQQQQHQQPRQGASPVQGQTAGGGGGSSSGYGQSGASAADPYGGYGAERQLTEEELEEQEVKHVKKQIQDTRQESIQSLNRSIALANQAADTGINTMSMLARDEERLINTEKRLDEAANYNKIGAEKAKKLKHLNRSMFAVHVSNPFTSQRRTAEYEESVLESHRTERELRQATRKNAWDSNQQMDKSLRNLELGPAAPRRDYRPSAAETNKYVFTDDDDEENAQALDDEATISRQMGELGGAVSLLNRVAKAQSQTVQRQIVSADRINEKTDMVDDGVRVNRARLDRIK